MIGGDRLDPRNYSVRTLGAIMVALVVIVASMLVGLNWYGSRSTQRGQAWGATIGSLQSEVLFSHLRLAELTAGGGQADATEGVVAQSQQSIADCHALRDGGIFRGQPFPPFPALSRDGDLTGTCENVDRLARLTRQRLGGTPSDEEGTEEDRAFDELFDTVLEDVSALEQAVGSATIDDRALLARVAYVLSVLLAVLLALMLWIGRRHATALEELSRRNEVVLEAAAEGIVGLDSAGTAVFVNPAAATLIGREKADIVGANAHQIVHVDANGAEDHTLDECGILAVAASWSGEDGGEGEFQRADGSSFPAEYTVSAVADDGLLDGAVLVFRDITERREVEEMKDQFVSLVSHELRTPLTSIHGSLGLLRGGALGEMPAKAQRMVDIATTNTDRLVRLINDILDIEKMRSGEMRMDREVIDAEPVVVQAVASMQGMAEKAGVDLSASTESVLMWADADRITQVIVNLVNNAIKFSQEGGAVEVELSVPGSDVVVAVADRGRGIPTDELGNVFNRFQQVDASDSRELGGTGLGLAICDNIVGRHDGRIWAEARPGGGTVVRFTLPVVQRHEDPEPTTGQSRATVLVVDDDPSVLEVVCSLLAGAGYRAIAASSGDEAIERATAAPPDAIVLDLLMPHTSGWEVLGSLRDDPATVDVPVVILSVVAEGDERLSPDDYQKWIEKPFDDKALIAALTQATRAHEGPLRAVIVEDDPDLAAVLSATFARHGIEAEHAGTAQQARAIVPGIQPDLIVLDLHLPDGDGVEVLHDLRAAGHLRGVPVVVYTGHDIEPEQRHQLDRDGAIVFTKTRVSPEEFEQRVLGLIGALVDQPTSR